MERVDMDFRKIDNTVEDIYKNYSNVRIESIQKAIKNGALGKYGRSYRLSTQEVCLWINEFLKESKPKLGI